MRTVRFLRDTDPEREGGPGFKSGQVHSLKDDSARHWVIRGAAEYVKDEPAKVSKPSPAKADEPKNEPAPAGETKEAEADGNAVEGSADVARDDSPGAGKRAEPAAKPAGGKGGGKGGKGRGNRG